MLSDSTVFVDTNVLLYSFDERDLAKRDRSRRWLAWCWAERRGRVSTQVVDELHANAVRKFSRVLSTEKARAEVRRLWSWNPRAVDEETVQGAWALQDRFSLGYWDALMLSAAGQLGCRCLLTEDLQHEQTIDGIRIVNPFLVGPEVLDRPVA